MHLSSAYIELVNRSFRLSGQEGHRPYPLASLEITLLDEARLDAAQREIALFQRLCRIFDWKLTRRQRRFYLNGLREEKTLVLTDLSDVVLWTSRNFLALTGYTPAEAKGQAPGLLPGIVETVRQRAIVRLQKGRSVNFSVCKQRKSGEPYLCQLIIDPLSDRQGNLTHYLSVEAEIKASTR